MCLYQYSQAPVSFHWAWGRTWTLQTTIWKLLFIAKHSFVPAACYHAVGAEQEGLRMMTITAVRSHRYWWIALGIMQQDARTPIMVLSSASPFAHTGLLAPIFLPSLPLSTRGYLHSPPHQMDRRQHMLCSDPSSGAASYPARIPTWRGLPCFRKCCCSSCSLCTIGRLIRISALAAGTSSQKTPFLFHSISDKIKLTCMLRNW